MKEKAIRGKLMNVSEGSNVIGTTIKVAHLCLVFTKSYISSDET